MSERESELRGTIQSMTHEAILEEARRLLRVPPRIPRTFRDEGSPSAQKLQHLSAIGNLRADCARRGNHEWNDPGSGDGDTCRWCTVRRHVDECTGRAANTPAADAPITVDEDLRGIASKLLRALAAEVDGPQSRRWNGDRWHAFVRSMSKGIAVVRDKPPEEPPVVAPPAPEAPSASKLGEPVLSLQPETSIASDPADPAEATSIRRTLISVRDALAAGDVDKAQTLYQEPRQDMTPAVWALVESTRRELGITDNNVRTLLGHRDRLADSAARSLRLVASQIDEDRVLALDSAWIAGRWDAFSAALCALSKTLEATCPPAEPSPLQPDKEIWIVEVGPGMATSRWYADPKNAAEDAARVGGRLHRYLLADEVAAQPPENPSELAATSGAPVQYGYRRVWWPDCPSTMAPYPKGQRPSIRSMALDRARVDQYSAATRARMKHFTMTPTSDVDLYRATVVVQVCSDGGPHVVENMYGCGFDTIDGPRGATYRIPMVVTVAGGKETPEHEQSRRTLAAAMRDAADLIDPAGPVTEPTVPAVVAPTATEAPPERAVAFAIRHLLLQHDAEGAQTALDAVRADLDLGDNVPGARWAIAAARWNTFVETLRGLGVDVVAKGNGWQIALRREPT